MIQSAGAGSLVVARKFWNEAAAGYVSRAQRVIGMVELSEEEWDDLLMTLRMEVIRAGYADWDRSALAALETQGPRAAVEDYLKRLISVLKIGSRDYRQMTRAGLSEMLADDQGRPVVDAVLIDDDGYEQASLLDGHPTDRLLMTLMSVQSDLFSGSGGYYGGGR